MEFKPIGIVHSPYKNMGEAPIQPRYSDAEGEIEISQEYADGLKDLDGFSHIWVIFHLHAVEGFKLHVKPYLEDELRGVFACRTPRRPNPVGLSLVKLVAVEGNVLRIKGLDMIDGTPVIDIKPYVKDFDEEEEYRVGWLEGRLSEGKDARGG